MFLGWPSSAITVTKDVKRLICSPLILVIFNRIGNFFGFARSVVGISWWEVAPDLTSIDSFPPKGMVGEFIELIPANFLSQEVLDIKFVEYLWQRCGVPKDVRKPHVIGGHT